MWRRSYQLLTRLRADSEYFRRNEDVIVATTNLVVLIFIMTGIVYETQHAFNPLISNYVLRDLSQHGISEHAHSCVFF